MSRRGRPRALGDVLGAARAAAEPSTPLAAVQAHWREAVGPRIATEATPQRERDGIVTVGCSSASWAQELDLLQDELLVELNRALGKSRIEGFRFRLADELDADSL